MIMTVGLNHQRTPIHIREKFYLNSTEQDLFLAELKCHPSVLEAFVLSTCNRTEIYAHVLNTQDHQALFIQQLAAVKKVKFTPEFFGYFYTYVDEDCVRHLFQVVSGLNSLVLGEKQILGQVKTAVERARNKGMFSQVFNILSNMSIRTGKKAQHETKISFGGSSVGWAGMMMAENLLGTLQGKSVLIIGAGKMGALTIQQLYQKGVKNLYLLNRTQCVAQELADKYQGTPISFYEMKDVLVEVDVCFCASSAPHYILERPSVEKIMPAREQKKLVLIDLSIPRNIDPAVAEIENVSLRDIDDMGKILEETMCKRREAMKDVEVLVDSKVEEFYRKLKKLQSYSQASSADSPFIAS